MQGNLRVEHDHARRNRTIALVGVSVAGIILMQLLGRTLQASENTRGLLGPMLAFLASQPFVLLFFTVALGYALGRVKLGGIGLGATVAILLIGLGLSLWASARGVDFQFADLTGSVFFNLFMFAIGMKVGPQFLSGLRRDARAFITIGLLVPLVSIGLMFAVRAVFHLEPGLLPGIFAGANTATPGIGAAKDVYLARQGPDSTAITNLATAFAFGYCVSLVLFVLLMKVLPSWFGKDARREAAAYQKQIESGGNLPLPGTSLPLESDLGRPEIRAFKIDHLDTDASLDELRRRYPRVAVERVLRGGRSLEYLDVERLEVGDTVALSGPITSLMRAEEVLGPEVDAEGLRDVPIETVDVVAQKDRSVGKSIEKLLQTLGHGFRFNALFRGGAQIPFGPNTRLVKGDVLRVTGSALRIKHLEQKVGGRAVHSSITTDIVTLALGLALGGLLGAIPLPIPHLRMALGSAIGLLLTGIFLSSVRTRHPHFGGPFPEPARQLIEDLGLNVFIAVTALNAGAGVVRAIQAGALTPILVGTVVVGLIPPIVGWAFGQYRHRMNAGLLTGAIAGARCSSPGLGAAQEETASTVPALSYPVTFAVSNVVVTLGCYLMAMMD